MYHHIQVVEKHCCILLWLLPKWIWVPHENLYCARLIQFTLSYHIFKIHFDDILSSNPTSSIWSLLQPVFWGKLIHMFNISHVCCISCSVHAPWFFIRNYVQWREKIIQLLTMQFIQTPITSSLSDPNVLFRVLFWNALKQGNATFWHYRATYLA